MSFSFDNIRAPKHSEEMQRWADLLMQWLRSPEFPGDVDILGDLSVTGNATIGAILQAASAKIGDVDGGDYFEVQADGDILLNGDADRLWTAVGGLYEHLTPITVVWGVGEADAWMDVTGLTVGGDPTRVTEDGTNGELEVTNAGKYLVGYDMSCAANAGLELHSQLARDSGGGYAREPRIAFRRDIGAGNTFGDASTIFPLTLAAGEKLKIQMQSDTASRTLTIDHLQFWCVRVAE